MLQLLSVLWLRAVLRRRILLQEALLRRWRWRLL